MAKHALRDKRALKENLDWYKEKERKEEVDKTSTSTSEWFEWFVTTEEYKELIKEISKDSKPPTLQTYPCSEDETGS